MLRKSMSVTPKATSSKSVHFPIVFTALIAFQPDIAEKTPKAKSPVQPKVASAKACKMKKFKSKKIFFEIAYKLIK